jgi:hypothetical protein
VLHDARYRAVYAKPNVRPGFNPTIGCCWDADRLDLSRVGIEPDTELMSTDAGRRWGRPLTAASLAGPPNVGSVSRASRGRPMTTRRGIHTLVGQNLRKAERKFAIRLASIR